MGVYDGRPNIVNGLSAFDVYHPIVPFACMATLIVFCMCAFQPVYLLLSFAGALSYSIYLRGWRQAVRTLRWQLPLIVIIMVVNPLFSTMGSTELFSIAGKAVYLESLVYGLNMGVMLVSVMLWFSNASEVLSTDKLMSLFGNVAPTFALMVSMANRLMPRFVSRATEVAAVQDVCMPPETNSAKGRVSERLRQTSVLMAWSMEDSLEMSDAMRARGWRAETKRTTYSRYRIHAFDVIFLVFFVILAVGDALLAFWACTRFSFYPTLSPLDFWPGYVPYAVLVFLPLLMQMGEWLRWRR